MTSSSPLTKGSKRPRRCRLVTTAGILSIIVIAQFVLFPFLLSFAVNHNNNHNHHRKHDDSLLDFFKSSTTTTTEEQRYPLPADEPVAGTFNGVPVFLRHRPLQSHVHCVGENYFPKTAWKQRSCRFSQLCFNTTAQEFVLWDSPRQQRLLQHLQNREFLHVSSSLRRDNVSNPTVSLGGLNMKWGHRPGGMDRLQWFPRIVQATENQDISYYALPDWMVWVPFHSQNGANPGHLVWDDFLPIYTLLDMFQLLPQQGISTSQTYLLPMRYILTNGERGLWASCDLREEKTEACRKMMNKFLGLLVGKDYPYQFSTTQSFQFMPADTGKNVDLVCARTGLAGIGSLTDHGIAKMHGWEPDDYATTHNHGRGAQLYNFRNFMLQNMGYSARDLAAHLRQDREGYYRHRVVFSQKSSEIFNRNIDFERQMQVVREQLPAVAVEGYVLRNYSLPEQLQLAHDASIFVSLCGGGAVTAMFLPAGASVFLYYSEDGGAKNNRMTHKPALLDWDLFNAMSHLRVHWLPRNSMKTAYDEQMLVDLVRHELSLMDQGVFVWGEDHPTMNY